MPGFRELRREVVIDEERPEKPVLSLSFGPLADADLACLKPLVHLQVLSLNGAEITDRGMANLKGLTRLTWFMLGGANLTDAGLANLKGMISCTPCTSMFPE